MTIPFLDLKRQYESIHYELESAVAQAISEFRFVRGHQVPEFENQFKKITTGRHCISTGNCTDALFVALKNLGVKPGDEILTPAFSWISSAQTITLCNATPVFVDVDARTYTIDPGLIEKNITAKTRGIILVHLYGQAAHASAIREICNRNDLFLIEDCAQAHLTQEDGGYAGTIGDIGTYSFYPTKNLGAYGDAGCVITNDDELAERIRRFSNHGALEKDDHLIEGMNSRMDTIQAAVLLSKLKYLKEWTKKRKQNADLYNSLLSDVSEITLPFARANTDHTFHLYVIRTARRDELKQFMKIKGVETMIHYPKALPNTSAYKYLNHTREDFPVSSRLQEEVLSLPIYPELTEEEIEYVCNCIKEFFHD